MSKVQSPGKPRFRVAVCGGGIAGLLLTVALSKYDDIEVNVYEAAENFKEIGAGVTVWGRAWMILSRLGLDREMRLAEDMPNEAHEPNFAFDFRRSDQPEEGLLWRAVRLPYVSVAFHRARFLDVLVKHLPKGVAHFHKRLATYSQLSSGTMSLGFSDGSTATCDVLLGCDGIRSAVRRQMFQDEAVRRDQPELLKHIEPCFSGSIVYRTLVPAELLLGKDGTLHPALSTPTIYCGRGKHLVSYPIAGGTMCNFAAIITDRSAEGKEYTGPWVTECSAQELADCCLGWEPRVQELLNLVHPRRPTKWAIHQLHPLPFSVSGNVALVGDSAHAMTPNQAAGACQAIEDAYVLAGLLGHPSTTFTTLSRVLKAYEHVRLPLGNQVMEGSRTSGAMFEFESEYGDDYEALGPEIEKQWDWVRGPDPHSDLERALKWCYHDESPTA